MNGFVSLLMLAWIVRIIGNVATYVQLWRVKEYRLDRMRIHLRTPQGKQFLFPTWKRPPITLKTVALILGTIGLMATMYSFLTTPWVFAFFLVDIASFPITFLIVGLVQIPTTIYHRLVIVTAIQKLRKHSPMTVIGITGSYGKTSTKDYAAAILAQQFAVIKTQGSKNSPIGIAEVIHKDLRPQHTVFVVEMGAYKRGEIAQMTRMVRPTIGVVTAINAQHQDLFGSLDTTMKAKYELIRGLGDPKIAIFNADNDRVRTMAHWASLDHCRVQYWTKVDGSIIEGTPMRATHIVASIRGISFDCVYGTEKICVNAAVLGEHQVSNIVAAIAIAVACGMEFPKAARAASTIKSAHQVMEPIIGVNESMFINDTFNNNPDAAKASIEFLRMGRAKKLLVFQPMIELGEYAQPSHTDVGAHAARYCDAILLTNFNYYHAFEAGVRSVSQTVPLLVVTPAKAAVYIRDHVGTDDIVLFKGKEAEHTLRILVAKK